MNNYDKLLREKENNQPLNDSNKEKNWAALEIQLLNTSNKPKRASNGRVKNLFKPLLGLVAVFIVGLFALKYFKTKTPDIIEPSVSKKRSAVKPPMPKLNVPYEIYTYDAATGDTLFTNNGSILIFPPNAVLDNNGKVVTGKVEIRTREFNDPLDYYMAGIPMKYDSAGVKYTFVSSGMIDIKAYQNGTLLKVNPNAKPQLNLVSTNKDKNTNLYVLDTVTGQWINKGKDEVNNVQVNLQKHSTDIPQGAPQNNNVQSQSNLAMAEEENTEPLEKPIQPQKASGQNPTIKITIDPRSFKELLAYDNLKFEVLNSNTEAVGENSKTEWDNVELLQKEGGKNYIAKFSSGGKSVQYEVKPVLEAKDFDAALRVYNEKIKAYYDLQKSRIANEHLKRDTLALRDKTIEEENKKTAANNELIIGENKLIEIENKRIEELNILIVARNKKIKEERDRYLVEIKRQQKISDSLSSIWLTQSKSFEEEIRKQKRIADSEKRIADSLRIIWERDNRALAVKENLLRSFTIDNFGYWNSDQPTFQSGIPIIAKLIDDQNNILQPININAVFVGINRIMTYDNSNIFLLSNTNHIIWSVYQNEFYYLTSNEYAKLNISYKTRNITFRLNKYEGEANSISELRKILYGG